MRGRQSSMSTTKNVSPACMVWRVLQPSLCSSVRTAYGVRLYSAHKEFCRTSCPSSVL